MKKKQMIEIGIGALLLVLIAASASALIMKDVMMREDQQKMVASAAPVHHAVHNRPETVQWNQPNAQPVQQAAATRCDDSNVVGYGLGALAGGLVGNQIGHGKGKTVATVGGAAAGALAGGQFIPTRGVLCP